MDAYRGHGLLRGDAIDELRVVTHAKFQRPSVFGPLFDETIGTVQRASVWCWNDKRQYCCILRKNLPFHFDRCGERHRARLPTKIPRNTFKSSASTRSPCHRSSRIPAAIMVSLGSPISSHLMVDSAARTRRCSSPISSVNNMIRHLRKYCLNAGIPIIESHPAPSLFRQK